MFADGDSLKYPGVAVIQSIFTPGRVHTDILAVAVRDRRRHLAIIPYNEDARFGGPTREAGGLKRLGRGGEWKIDVPDGARLFIATSGMSPEDLRLQQLWAGWLDAGTVVAISVRQGEPMRLALEKTDEVVMPPLTLGDKSMHLYTLRRDAGDRRTLWRHVFSDGSNGQKGVSSQPLATIEGAPLFATAAPLLDDSGVRSVLGWLELTPAGVVAVLARVDGVEVHVVRSEPVPSLIPFAHQRLGLWIGSREMELGGVLHGPATESPYTGLAFHYTPDGEPEKHRLSLKPCDLPPGRLRACATDYRKDEASAEPVLVALDTEGTLLSPSESGRQIFARGLPPDYPLPLATSTRFFYFAEADADGEVKVWHWTEKK